MRVGVIQFPGSNADWDAYHVVKHVMGESAEYVFHKESSLPDVDAIIIPGGFSYGDYLRPGAIAGYSPITQSIVEFANSGKPVLGICNGFQILCELGLLPGALTRNAHLRFECRSIHVRVESQSAFTAKRNVGRSLRMPIAHADGRYHCDDATLAMLNDEERVVFRYCNREAVVSDAENPNGSRENIAGICNAQRNVVGMMPHPERASESLLGSAEGFTLFQALRETLK